jgi:hypothetical protein
MVPDKYGHCCLCHKDLLLPRIVGGKEIMMFTPEFDQTEFVLSNKSRMVVCMCKPCKASVDLSNPDIHSQIMESVIAGWDMEQGIQPTGDAKKDIKLSDSKILRNGASFPKDYKNMDILFHSEGIDDYVVQNRLATLGQ